VALLISKEWRNGENKLYLKKEIYDVYSTIVVIFIFLPYYFYISIFILHLRFVMCDNQIKGVGILVFNPTPF